MLFNSINFMIFFPIVVLIYFIIPDKVKYMAVGSKLFLLYVLECKIYYFDFCFNCYYICKRPADR